MSSTGSRSTKTRFRRPSRLGSENSPESTVWFYSRHRPRFRHLPEGTKPASAGARTTRQPGRFMESRDGPRTSEPSSVGAARVWVGLVVIASPIHAAPTELDAPYGGRGYKHGAPNGAFRSGCPAVDRQKIRVRCTHPPWLRDYYSSPSRTAGGGRSRTISSRR